MVQIRVAVSPSDFPVFSGLVREYVDWCRERYADEEWLVDAAFGHQALADELVRLDVAYTAPKGLALLAKNGDDNIGCVAFRKLDEHTCEMKRLFVSKRGRRIGLARRLCETLVVHAASQGYRVMRLDTATRLFEAIALYKSMGFFECPAYIQYPSEFANIMLFMERTLPNS